MKKKPNICYCGDIFGVTKFLRNVSKSFYDKHLLTSRRDLVTWS